MKELKKYFTYEVLELALRIWAAFYVFIYGIGKWTQFEGAKSMSRLIKDASNSEIMWAFFGTTREYPIIIGLLQIIGAVLLVFQRTKIIGALLLTPIFINIILLDIFYKIHRGALLNAMLFQFVFFLVIFNERKQIKLAINLLTKPTGKSESDYILSIKLSIVIPLAILLFIIHQAII